MIYFNMANFFKNLFDTARSTPATYMNQDVVLDFLGELPKETVRQTVGFSGRAAIGLGEQISGRKEMTPETRLEKFIFGPEPIKPTLQHTKDVAEMFGFKNISQRTALLLAIPLTAAELDPRLPSAKKAALNIASDVSSFIRGAKSVKEALPGGKLFSGLRGLSTKLLESFRGLPEEITQQQFNEVVNRATKKGIRKADLDLVREAMERQIPSIQKNVAKELGSSPELLKFQQQGTKINLTKLAKDVETQLVPLTPTPVKSPRWSNVGKDYIGDGKYGEIVYQSPIKTRAGDVHYRHVLGREYNKSNPPFPNYFSHVRYEDMADGKTRKILETQSDLMQKENFVREGYSTRPGQTQVDMMKEIEQSNIPGIKESPIGKRIAEIAKLSAYESNDPLAHLRTFREEVKRAAKDGKDTLLTPTGKTAMKIEGLGDPTNWYIPGEGRVVYNELNTGQEIIQGFEGGVDLPYVITDILGDGKFKAVPKEIWQEINPATRQKTYGSLSERAIHQTNKEIADRAKETFDIS